VVQKVYHVVDKTLKNIYSSSAMSGERVDRIFDALNQDTRGIIPEWVMSLSVFDVPPETKISEIISGSPSSEVFNRFNHYLYFGNKNLKLREIKIIRGALELLSEPDILKEYFPNQDNMLTIGDVKQLDKGALIKLGLSRIQRAVVNKLFNFPQPEESSPHP